MIKNIKRAGIIFLAIAIICLMVIGCLSVNSVASNGSNFGILSSDKSNSANSNLNNGNANGSYNVDTLTYEIPQADVVKYLQHKENCSDSSTCNCLQEVWTDVSKLASKGQHIKLILMTDWVARLADEETERHDFGSGVGFDRGAIYIMENQTITIDLNGFNIDRDMLEKSDDSEIPYFGSFNVLGTLNLMDSGYQSDKVKAAYNANKDADLVNVAIANGAGKITGGNGEYGGGLFINNKGILNIYSGVICDNKVVSSGGGIYANLNTVVNIYDGLVANNQSKERAGAVGISFFATANFNMYGGFLYNNTADRGGAIACLKSMSSDPNTSVIINVNGGVIANNTAISYGGAVYYYNDVLPTENLVFNINGGVIENNKIEKPSNNGGAFNIDNVTLNIINGKIQNNTATGSAGGILANNTSIINIYGGEISNNNAYNYGGGIYALKKSIVNMYGGKISGNSLTTDTAEFAIGYGGGVYITSEAQFNMYDGEITENNSRCGGGVCFHNKGTGVIYGGRIANNKTTCDSTGIQVFTNSKLVMNGGIVEDNVLERTAKAERIYAAGVGVSDKSIFIMNGGQIINNRSVANGDINAAGNGLSVLANSRCELNNGLIYGNTIETGGLAQGAVYFENSNLAISGTIQIFGNKAKDKNHTSLADCDIYLQKGQKIQFTGNICGQNALAKMGIYLADDYVEGSEFTQGFKSYSNLSLTLPYYFISNKAGKTPIYVDVNGTQEVAFTDYTGSALVKYDWQIIDSANNVLSVNNSHKVTYTGKPFTIKVYKNGTEVTFNMHNGGTGLSSFNATNVGEYTYLITDTACVNPTFKLTIEPKEVDVIWKNTDLVYTGSAQKPTAEIAESALCKVIVSGEQVHSGTYYATAMELSNPNYTISEKTKIQKFTIAKAKVTKQFSSGNFAYTGENIEFLPIGFDNDIMLISGNVNSNAGKYKATISLKDLRNYEWTDGTNSVVNVDYAITFAPPINEDDSVYNFVYYDETDGTRKTYKEGGLVHGINDSKVNGGKAIIGNIAPNTSVKVFIENLGFDTNNIQLFAGNKLVYDKTNGYVLTDNNYDNGTELAVGTGWHINYTAVNGEVETIYLSALGDLTGDGKVNSADVNYLRQIVNNNSFESLSAEQKLAALIVNKGKEPTSTDVQILWEAVCGRIDINEFI